MFTTLVSFLGGSAFRLIFGAVMDLLNKKQDHEHEMALQRLQSDLDELRHGREMDRLRTHANLKIQEIRVASDAVIAKADADAFIEAVKGTTVKTGVSWVDAWNQAIRPTGATISLVIWLGSMVAAGFVFREFDETLIAAFLGVFVGERIHNSLRK